MARGARKKTKWSHTPRKAKKKKKNIGALGFCTNKKNDKEKNVFYLVLVHLVLFCSCSPGSRSTVLFEKRNSCVCEDCCVHGRQQELPR